MGPALRTRRKDGLVATSADDDGGGALDQLAGCRRPRRTAKGEVHSGVQAGRLARLQGGARSQQRLGRGDADRGEAVREPERMDLERQLVGEVIGAGWAGRTAARYPAARRVGVPAAGQPASRRPTAGRRAGYRPAPASGRARHRRRRRQLVQARAGTGRLPVSRTRSATDMAQPRGQPGLGQAAQRLAFGQVEQYRVGRLTIAQERDDAVLARRGVPHGAAGTVDRDGAGRRRIDEVGSVRYRR